ncbi:hypothetical protein C8J56DRAFT_980523 [Mycena floridula]|nr:hypothetical protein C8J56DRAFT_980523 [Mycena floridula]
MRDIIYCQASQSAVNLFVASILLIHLGPDFLGWTSFTKKHIIIQYCTIISTVVLDSRLPYFRITGLQM